MHRRGYKGLDTSRAEAPTPETSETDDSAFVSELVRQAIARRKRESKYPLGWPDPQKVDRVLRKFARRR